MIRSLALCLLPAVALATPAYLPFKMLNTDQDKFGYYLDSRNATPAGLSLGAVQSATNSAWAQWNGVGCASPKTQSLGFSGATIPKASDPYDAFNVTPVWILSFSEPDWAAILGSYQIKAITLPLAYAGVLTQCDIYLNGANATWSTATGADGGGIGGSLDLETVMLHEEGHCLGLDHFGIGNVMAASVESGFTNRVLNQQDIDALCERNPLTGGLGSPCPDGGGCGTSSGLKCVTQPLPTGNAKFCTVGCQDGTGFQCDALSPSGIGLYCQASTFFSPTFSGACLRSGNTVTTVGSPCVAGSNCSSSLGVCQPDVGPGYFPRWVGGYCTQACGAGKPTCPAGGVCTTTADLPDGGTARFCLASCRVGLADCRPEYSCALTVNGGVCIPSCHADFECGDVVNYQCRTCDGLCVARQNVAGQIGDVCNLDTQCGAGQICSGVGLCTLPCGKGCGDCPTGAACHPIAPTNALYCLRTCTGPGTCQPGTRCANLPTGRGCVPACLMDSDCNVGENCISGECINPFEDDAGCGAFCMTFDSGHPIVPPPKDGGGGGGGGGTGGCGCSTPSDFAALFAAAAVLWASSRRRVEERTWRRR